MPKKKTQEQFIADARKVHGDRYDYSLAEYVNSQTKVKIICRTHGVFEQKAGEHVQGKGCAKCSGRCRKTREEFIEQARSIHGDFYNYDKVEYINDSEKVIITCPKHGDFLMRPDSHLHQKQGCKLCAHERIGLASRMSQEDFIERARKVHKGFYTYDKVEYKESHTLVTITCPVHGDYRQLAYQHLAGHGCKKCATLLTIEKESVSVSEFIERAKACHSIEYDYSHVNLNGMHSLVHIVCPIHGDFWQRAATHLKGHDCPKCGYIQNSLKRTKPLEKFIEDAKRVHGEKYDYSETVYVNAKVKLAIRCKAHNMIFWQKPNAHLNGNGCPLCAQSHLENDILRLLKAQKIAFEAEKTFSWLKYQDNMYIDYFLPEYGVAIECQGEQHFRVSEYYGGEKAFRTTKRRDELKKRLCEEHGITMIYYSNLGIKYPYKVIESQEGLLLAIKEKGKIDNPYLWQDPELPFEF